MADPPSARDAASAAPSPSSSTTDTPKPGRKSLGNILFWTVVVLVLGAFLYLIYRQIRYYYFTPVGRGELWASARLVLAHLKIIGLVVASLLALSVIYMSGQFAGSRWRRLRVFISYQHALEDKVRELAQALTKHGMNVRFIPYVKSEHDATLTRVLHELRETDALLILPGLEASFVDAEILSAAALRKPVIFIKPADEQTLPNTAYQGYPVFRWAAIQAGQFRPLEDFLDYACNTWRDVPRTFRRAWSKFFILMGGIFALYIGLSFVSEVSEVIGYFSLRWAIIVQVAFLWIAFVLSVVAFVVGFVLTVLAKFRAIRIAKQTIVTGNLTYKLLEEGLNLSSDRLILAALERQSLKLRY